MRRPEVGERRSAQVDDQPVIGRLEHHHPPLRDGGLHCTRLLLLGTCSLGGCQSQRALEDARQENGGMMTRAASELVEDGEARK